MAKKSRSTRAAGSRSAATGLPASAPAGAPSTLPASLASALADPGALLALAAFALWVVAHLPPFAPIATPAWVVTGLLVGLWRPWYGLLLTIVIVPFTGAAIDVPTGEPLRVVPLYAAAVRVLLDRFVIAPSYGRPTTREPAWWAVAAALIAAGLFLLSALTAYLASGRDERVLTGGLLWSVAGPVALLAAWVAAAHLVAGRDRTFTLVVLGATVAASTLALAAWVGIPGVSLFTFAAVVEGGRLGALGYPTPTAMGLATVLPLAVAAAWRLRPWLVIPVAALVMVALVLTWSRGPLIALAIGTVIAALASGRVDRRLALGGAVAVGVALVAVVAVRYGTTLDAIRATFEASMGGDTDRIRSWGAAISIAIASPFVGGGWDALIRIADFEALRIANAHNMLLDALAVGGFPLGIANAIVVVWSAWMTWVRRHTMAVWLIAAVVTFLICGLWDIPQIRSYAAVMGGMVLGMAAGPLIGRSAEAGAEPA